MACDRCATGGGRFNHRIAQLLSAQPGWQILEDDNSGTEGSGSLFAIVGWALWEEVGVDCDCTTQTIVPVVAAAAVPEARVYDGNGEIVEPGQSIVWHRRKDGTGFYSTRMEAVRATNPVTKSGEVVTCKTEPAIETRRGT